MLTLTDHITEYLDLTKDASAANKARGIRYFNELQRILASSNPHYWWREGVRTKLTVAGQQAYKKPIDCEKIIAIYMTVDGVKYPLVEVPTPEKFHSIDSNGNTVTDNYAVHYIEQDHDILLFPTPSTSNIVITFLVVKRVVDMSVEDYSTGTIAVTINSKIVTGTSTVWSTNIKAGAYLIVNRVPYLIESVDSNTQITLSQEYEGITATGLSYKVGDVSVIPEPFQAMLHTGAARNYYIRKEGTNKAQNDYQAIFRDYELRLEKFSESKKSGSQVIKGIKASYRSINDFPQNIG